MWPAAFRDTRQWFKQIEEEEEPRGSGQATAIQRLGRTELR